MRGLVRRLAVLVVAVVGGAYLVFAFLLPLPGGPLDGEEGGGAEARGAQVGQRLTLVADLENTTARRPELDEIEVVGVDPGLEVLGVDVTRERYRPPTGQGGYPPSVGEVRLRRPEGYRMPRSGSVRIVYGVRVRRPGEHRIDGLRIAYQDRSLRRRVEVGPPVIIRAR